MNSFLDQRLRFFFSITPVPCPYLNGQVERRIATELAGPDADEFHNLLSHSGFRRNNNYAYIPACPSCSACTSVRVVVDEFRWSRSFRRTWKSNEDLKAEFAPVAATMEQFDLFKAYVVTRHEEGDMADMEFEHYRAMIEDTPVDTYLVEYRTDDDVLVAVMLLDKLDDGLSAVYSFFDPELPYRGFGNYMILWLIAHAESLELPYVYLGYWVPDSPKMDYKNRFQPLEYFRDNEWVRDFSHSAHD